MMPRITTTTMISIRVKPAAFGDRPQRAAPVQDWGETRRMGRSLNRKLIQIQNGQKDRQHNHEDEPAHEDQGEGL